MAKKKRRRSKQPLIKSGFMWLMSLAAICLTFYGVLMLLIEPNSPLFKNETSKSEVFIQRLAPHSKKIQRTDGLLPSITLGQAILESDWGTSSLSSQYNNLFGIKAFGDEPKVVLSTKEFVDGEWLEVPAAFRSYVSWEASMDDHVDLFKQGVSWNRDLYKDVLNASDYRQAAQALQLAGYATDPNYEDKIIEVIESYQLNRFD